MYTGDDAEADLTMNVEESDDEQDMSGGLQSLLRVYAPAAKVPVAKVAAKAKALATATSTPLPKVKAKAKSSTGVKRAPPGDDAEKQPLKRPKVTIGTAKVSKGKDALDLDTGLLGDDSLSGADKAIIDGFEEQFKAYKVIKPPLADAQYKAHLSDLLGKVNAQSCEIKKKLRSSMRRSSKTEDPLYIELERLSSGTTTLQHLIKCTLIWKTICYSFSKLSIEYKLESKSESTCIFNSTII